MKDWNEIKAWRRAQREQLIVRREGFGPEQRRQWSGRITELLKQGFPALAGLTVGFCWPYRGEFDARFAIRHWRGQGATAALPEVVARGLPLRFRKWWPGAPMAPGAYGIPAPDGTGIVTPDAVVVPMNGFDGSGYRLGYGGGYFDRTLAAVAPRPLAVGVSFDALRIATIFPQPHDVPMDFVVTETGIHASGGDPLAPLDVAKCRERVARLLAARRLSRGGGGEITGRYAPPACYAHEFPDYRSGAGNSG
jgi:5-formyltetrahydrofolate cyclo-ligase